MAPLEVEIYGPNLDVLQELGEEFRLRMERFPMSPIPLQTWSAARRKWYLELQEEKLRLAHLQLSDVRHGAERQPAGRIGGEVLEGTERLPVRVRLREQDWGTPDRIGDIRIPLPAPASGTRALIAGIPLNALAVPELVPSQSPISRFNGEAH